MPDAEPRYPDEPAAVTNTARRSRGAANRDKEAIDNIAALLNQPIACRQSELAAHDRDCIMQIASFVEASGRA